MVYPYNGILLYHTEECSFEKCCRMDGLGKYYAKWNKPYMKGLYFMILKVVWFTKTGSRFEVTRGGVEGANEKLMLNGYKISVWSDDGNILKIVMMITQHCKCTWCHWIIHLKMVIVVKFMFMCILTQLKFMYNIYKNSM